MEFLTTVVPVPYWLLFCVLWVGVAVGAFVIYYGIVVPTRRAWSDVNAKNWTLEHDNRALELKCAMLIEQVYKETGRRVDP